MRLLGALLLTAAAALLGVSALLARRREAQTLRQLERTAALLCFELEHFLQPMPELAVRLAHSAPPAGAALFSRLSGRMGELADRGFAALWLEALDGLPAVAAEALAALAPVLGRYGAQEQRAAAEACRARLEELCLRAEEANRRNGRVYIGLSASAGAVIALMLL